uniref:Uncharacterized protein n=1 Tax=Zea mays TaxID=4577 RepID=A0A804MN19_MAIZE
MDRRSMTPGISSRLSSPPSAAHPSPPPAAAPSAAATPSHPPSPTPDAFTRLEEKWDQFVVMFHRYKEKTEKELQAAVRLQAAARGFLARRQAVVRLQATVRGFLVRRAVRKLHLLISSSLHQLVACASNHQVSSILFEPPAEVEIWEIYDDVVWIDECFFYAPPRRSSTQLMDVDGVEDLALQSRASRWTPPDPRFPGPPPLDPVAMGEGHLANNSTA